MQINEQHANQVKDALQRALRALSPDASQTEIIAAQNDIILAQSHLCTITDNRAEPALIERARSLQAVRDMGDDCEIDDDAGSSRGDTGYWVQAWVWVPYDETDDALFAEEVCS